MNKLYGFGANILKELSSNNDYYIKLLIEHLKISLFSIVISIILGVGIGIITMLIRYWGAYPEGISFAILIMNATVPLINMYFKPAKFGREVKYG